MALSNEAFEAELRNIRDTAKRGEDYWCLPEMSYIQKRLAWLEFLNNRKSVKDVISNGRRHPSFHLANEPLYSFEYSSLFFKSLGLSIIVGAMSNEIIFIVSFILFFGLGYAYLKLTDFEEKPQPDKTQREDFKKWYKEMFNKDI